MTTSGNELNTPLSDRSITSLKRQREDLKTRKATIQGMIDALEMEIQERDPCE